ncbi:FeoB small GTPase domain-containing protein [Natronospora cellulosivora (SeqCode)]
MKASKLVDNEKKVLLIGPPNVGKSVFFNRLTGLDVAIANYAGTTVDFKVGNMYLANQKVSLIDVPGTYTLDATNQAEEVAVEILSQNPEMVICVLDANNIESSLYLLLQILERNLPTIVALNRVDIAEEKGYSIDIELLSEKLGIEVVPTVAIRGEGFEILKDKIKAKINEPDQNIDYNIEASWSLAEELAVLLKKNVKERTFLNREKWGELLVQPWPGIPLAIIILSLIFAVVVGLGMGIRQYILLPFFRNLVFPYIVQMVESITSPGLIQNILIGEYGFLIKGLEWPFALVLPYIISFYTALSLLEDSGYLPRLGILLDGLLSKMGLSGANIIPLLLGYGCAIPGIAATRAMSTEKERLMVSTMICLSVPCVAQTGAFISLLSEQSILLVILLFMLSFLAIIISGLILNFFIDGERPETVVEVPELLVPKANILGKKIWIRLRTYIFNGAKTMFYAIAVAAVLYEIGAFEYIGQLLQPIVTGWLRLPQEAAVPLVLGIVRRELSVLPLLDMNLSNLQLFVGATVGLFYVPCIAVLAILAREFKASIALMVLTVTTITSFLLGGFIARFGGLFF